MGTVKTIGTAGLRYEPAELLHDPRRGMSVRQRVGVNVENFPELVNVMRQIQAAGGSGRMVLAGDDPVYEYEISGVLSNLNIPELFFDDWQMPSNDLTDTIFANTLITNRLNYNDKVVLERLVTDGGTLEDAISNCNLDLANGLTAPNPGNGGTSDGKFQNLGASGIGPQLLRQIKKGQAEYLAPKIVLHHTSCCSPNAGYNAVRANEMKIYAPGQLLTEIGPGSHLWTYPCPPDLLSQISNFPTESAPADESAYYTWGWLKKRATRATQSNFAIEVHQEYELGLWPNLYYAEVT